MSDLFSGKGIEIELANPDDFLKVKETLTRIGVASKKNKVLYQSCHIFHKQGKYIICHFKELFELDGKESNINLTDISRRDTIAKLLEDWGLIKILDKLDEDRISMSLVKIIPHKEKGEWELVQKYNIGKNKKRVN